MQSHQAKSARANPRGQFEASFSLKEEIHKSCPCFEISNLPQKPKKTSPGREGYMLLDLEAQFKS